MSALPRSAPFPVLTIRSIASFTLVYANENSSLFIPSFTLWSNGYDRSKMSRQPLLFLGMTPITLMCNFCTGGSHLGPTTLSSATSFESQGTRLLWTGVRWRMSNWTQQLSKSTAPDGNQEKNRNENHLKHAPLFGGLDVRTVGVQN